MDESKNIAENAMAADSLTTLVTAVQAAGLAEALQAEGPLTVFAPSNDAFAKLPEGTVDTLVMPENKEKLTGILTYHVVAGKFAASDLADGEQMVPTLNGQELTIVKSADGVTVNGANVIMADVMSSNGVVHVIDTVLMPS